MKRRHDKPARQLPVEHGSIYHRGHPVVKENWRRVRSAAAQRGWQTRRNK